MDDGRTAGLKEGRAARIRTPTAPWPSLPSNYKWMALFISTLGMLMATIDGSIVLIALPDIFRGIGIDPLQPGNSFYLLWMILGFLVVTSVLVVSLGRMGDIYGRVRTYNLGFAVFTFFSLLLSITWMSGHAAGIWLIVMRIFQGVGAAMLMANSSAILTDAFPRNQRGMALGVNQAAAFSGTFIGLVLGGVLAPINWRLIFLVSVPIGLFGTVCGYLKLRETSPRRPARIDWPGNITFAVGLILVMVGITYGIEPYGHHAMGWTSPVVIGPSGRRGGAAGRLLRHRDQGRPADVPAAALQDPGLHQRRARQLPGRAEPGRADVHAHHLAAGHLAAAARLHLQPYPPVGRHRHAPAHRRASSSPARCRGSCPTATAPGPSPPAACSAPAVCFALLELLPVDFPYWRLRRPAVLHRPDHGRVRLAQPGRRHEQPAARAPRGRLRHEHHLPELGPGPVHRDLLHPDDRRAVGVAARRPLPRADRPRGARPRGRAGGSHLSPVSTLFAAFLGYDPVQHLVGAHVLSQLPWPSSTSLTGRSFFPGLISAPFQAGLHAALDFAIVASLLAAGRLVAAGWAGYVYRARG